MKAVRRRRRAAHVLGKDAEADRGRDELPDGAGGSGRGRVSRCWRPTWAEPRPDAFTFIPARVKYWSTGSVRVATRRSRDTPACAKT